MCNPPICLGKIFLPPGMCPIGPGLSAGPPGIVWGRRPGVYLIAVLIEPFVDNLNLSLVQSVSNLRVGGRFSTFSGRTHINTKHEGSYSHQPHIQRGFII